MQIYSLDTPRNIADRSFAKDEVQTIIAQRIPCGDFSIIAREARGSSQTATGSGIYIKRAESSCYIEVIDEQGTCQGLMASLFREQPVRVAPRFPQTSGRSAGEEAYAYSNAQDQGTR